MFTGTNWKVNFERSQLTPVPFVTLLCLIAVFLGFLPFGYPPFAVSSLVIAFVAGFVFVRFGPFSVPALFTALITYPLLVPFIAAYVLGVPYYAYRGRIFQSTPVVNEAIFIGASLLSVFAVILEVGSRLTPKKTISWYESSAPVLSFSISSFVVLGVLYLVSSYLTTPGPTLLTASYSEVLNNYYSWAQFAGSLFMGSWIGLYLLVRGEANDSWVYRSFAALTFVGVLWLLLHSRRNESLGVLVMFTLDFVRNRIDVFDFLRTPLGVAASAFLGVLFLIQVVVGSFRLEGESIGAPDIVQPAGYAAFPGGAHNIYGTYQATVALFPTERGYLLGETFSRYLLQSVPSGVFSVLPVEYPPLYSSFLGDAYATYLGGNFILNPYYANFGPVGIFVLALALGLLVYWIELVLFRRGRTTFDTGVAAVFVVGAFRACWYTQLAWIDTFQGFLASVVLLVALSLVETTDVIDG